VIKLRLLQLFVALLALGLVACEQEATISIDIKEAEQPPAVHLLLGNPSDAATDITTPDNFLLRKRQFALSYNNSLGTANWVAWHMSPYWRGSASRQNDFRPDPELPADFVAIRSSDYTGYGFDRGHLCPSADRLRTREDNSATFVMTNIIPQAPDLNQEPWRLLEEYCRDLVYQEGQELYIYAGGYGLGGSGTRGYANRINQGSITVPERYWKVILVIDYETNDLSRITPETRVIAVDMPNNQTADNKDWWEYRVSVDAIEATTGLDFFQPLADEIEETIEGMVDEKEVN